MSVLQKIAEIEAEMARTQKNKATNFHLGLLKAKLAKLKGQLVRTSLSVHSNSYRLMEVVKEAVEVRGMDLMFPKLGMLG